MKGYTIEPGSRTGGRPENQDCFQYSETDDGLAVIVCDGMGGPPGGKYAAWKTVRTVIEGINFSKETFSAGGITTALHKANDLIFKESMNNYALTGMGTTVAVLYINEKYATCFHAGDSRIYQFRDESIVYRTFDHSVVFEDVGLGLLTEEEARTSSDNNIITKAIGIDENVEITCSGELTYKKGDRFLICTDGIWGAVPEKQLTTMSVQSRPVKEIINELIEIIDRTGADAGGSHDNLTAVLIEMLTDSI